MPTLTCEVSFEVFCGNCREGMCHLVTEGITPGRGMQFLTITPCEACTDKARDEGENKGYELGHRQGEKEGYAAGVKDGHDAAERMAA